jgi:hypothetical protein
LTIAKQNGYPASKIHTLKTREINKKQNQKQQHEKTNINNQKWVTFTYFSPLIRRITNLFKNTNLKVAFRATNTIQQQLTKKENCKDPSGIYKLECNTCHKAYVGQSGRAITVRYKEHIRYIRTNNPKSAYATHILNNRHEYGTAQNTLKLIQACQKGKKMDCWEALHIYALHQQGTLIDEQQASDANPLFQLAIITNTNLE